MNKSLIFGALWGLIAPFIGIFFGLQVSVMIGNILAFPIIGLSYITGTPFGMWSMGMMLFALFTSIVVWAALFWVLGRLFLGKN